MPAITIRDVPQDTRDELAARAAAKGQSLQEYLSSVLASLAARADPEQLLASVRARKRAINAQVGADEILEHRDAERR